MTKTNSINSTKLTGHKLFVGGLIPTCDEGTFYIKLPLITIDEIKDYFLTFGEMTNFELIREKKSKEPRGFAFVYYKQEEDANKCLKAVHHLYGRRVT